MKTIELIEQWHELAKKLTEHGYRIWQMQFNTKAPEGFHAWFSKTGRKDLEVVTHNDAVYNAIVKYK